MKTENVCKYFFLKIYIYYLAGYPVSGNIIGQISGGPNIRIYSLVEYYDMVPMTTGKKCTSQKQSLNSKYIFLPLTLILSQKRCCGTGAGVVVGIWPKMCRQPVIKSIMYSTLIILLKKCNAF